MAEKRGEGAWNLGTKKAAGNIRGESIQGGKSGSARIGEEEIRRAAYLRWLDRGAWEHGRDQEDWFIAEQQMKSRSAIGIRR